MKQVVLHIPHASTVIPLSDGYVVNQYKLNNEVLKLTDWYTDDIFSSKTDISIVTPFSRVFCDVERFVDDASEVMSKSGMGVLYERCDDDIVLRNITPKLRDHIIDNYYWSHHDLLSKTISQQLKLRGSCIIIDCHSFPEIPLLKALDQRLDRPDFNIGTDAYHTPFKYVEASVSYFESHGYTLGIDYPYSGSIVPMSYYKKDKRVNSIMLEVNRRLYLDKNLKSSNYEKTKEVVQGFIELIKNLN